MVCRKVWSSQRRTRFSFEATEVDVPDVRGSDAADEGEVPRAEWRSGGTDGRLERSAASCGCGWEEVGMAESIENMEERPATLGRPCLHADIRPSLPARWHHLPSCSGATSTASCWSRHLRATAKRHPIQGATPARASSRGHRRSPSPSGSLQERAKRERI
ncbi:hypothetical protein [Oryza sativa Japonica Group]|uniref:Uncharacterized protein n=2 Tax=Oryza sativa subsp. japonica TaxID=39947 RepID=Q5JMP8_ORYSJ|nr:hypothetical protein [Oryza sativa Japonica Group]BAD87274.1 hypothetical protein [Oryza sativa Japonica Group]